MKIVSWNCNGAFRKKYDFLLNIDWDVAIIQECENPESINDAKYHSLFKEKIWIGANKNKGVGIFTREKKIEIDLRYSNLSTEYEVSKLPVLETSTVFSSIQVSFISEYVRP